MPPLMAPTGAPTLIMDPTFLKQLVRAVRASMSNTTSPVTPSSIDHAVALVWLVKKMREMGCEPFLGEQDAEVARRWIRKVEITLIQVEVPEELRMDCVTRLISDSAQT